jgi:hypothetical protein
MSTPASSAEEQPAAAPAALPSTPPSSADTGTALPPSQLSLQPTAPGSQLDSSAADVTMAAADAPAAPLAASAEPQPPSSRSSVSSPACGPQPAAASKPASLLELGTFETDQGKRMAHRMFQAARKGLQGARTEVLVSISAKSCRAVLYDPGAPIVLRLARIITAHAVAAAAREAEQKTAELAEDPSVIATATRTADSSAAVTTVAAAAAEHARNPSAVTSSASEAISENALLYEHAAMMQVASKILPPESEEMKAVLPPADADSAPHSRSSVQLLLQYARAVSDHTIRKGLFFEPNFPGSLVSQWQPQEWKYRVPLSLVWAYDEQANKMRNDSQDVADWQKVMPLLPMYTFSVAGDGDCLMHSAILADCTLQQREFAYPDAPAAVQKKTKTGEVTGSIPTLKAIAQTVVSAARDPLTGAVLPSCRVAVSDALHSYRARSAHIMRNTLASAAALLRC